MSEDTVIWKLLATGSDTVLNDIIKVKAMDATQRTIGGSTKNA